MTKLKRGEIERALGYPRRLLQGVKRSKGAPQPAASATCTECGAVRNAGPTCVQCGEPYDDSQQRDAP